MPTCRICMRTDGAEQFYPCRCTAPVHRLCLDSWRTSGVNPANLTRCEVCCYHYRMGEMERPVTSCAVHWIFYSVAFCCYGLLFFGLAAAFGYLIRSTEILNVVDWGRLTFIKPETIGGFIFFGFWFNFFLILGGHPDSWDGSKLTSYGCAGFSLWFVPFWYHFFEPQPAF